MRTVVGVFDSGVGGLTVADALHRLSPTPPLRYLADSAGFPYGERSERDVADRASRLAQRLVDDGCALLVIACHTATSAALERLRSALPVPVVGVEPPLKPAAERSRSRRVAVLVTPATARGERLTRLHRDHAGDAQVETVPMPGLARAVEAGEVGGPRVERLLREALAAPLRRGVDQVALGCTHYGFVRPALERVLAGAAEVIDAAAPVARRTRRQLEAYAPESLDGDGEQAERAEQPVICSTTGDPTAFEALLQRLRAAGAQLPPLRVLPERERLAA